MENLGITTENRDMENLEMYDNMSPEEILIEKRRILASEYGQEVENWSDDIVGIRFDEWSMKQLKDLPA